MEPHLIGAFMALIQAAASDPNAIPWPAIGVGSGPTALSAVMLYFYRQRELQIAAQKVEERAALALERKESEARYAALAQDFREIVEKNTAVITRLLEPGASRHVR